MFTRDRHKLSEVCTKCRKEKPSFKTVVSLLIILVTSWLFRPNLHNGNVSDTIQLKTGHLVEHPKGLHLIFLSPKKTSE